MSIKVLAILAGVSFMIAILVLVLTLSPRSAGNEENGTVTSTTLAPTVDPRQPPGEGLGKIVGNICVNPLDNQEKGVWVVAEQTVTRERFAKFISGPISEQMIYGLEVKPGEYQVFTETNKRNKVGLYSQFILCGQDGEACLEHDLVAVIAEINQITAEIDICDYEWVSE